MDIKLKNILMIFEGEYRWSKFFLYSSAISFWYFSVSYISSSDQEGDDYSSERDRPLPYTRPSVDPISTDFSSKTSELIV